MLFLKNPKSPNDDPVCVAKLLDMFCNRLAKKKPRVDRAQKKNLNSFFFNLYNKMSSILNPQNFDIVFAFVEQGSIQTKTKVLAEWLTAWLKFQKLCNVQGTVVFDIDDTLVDHEESRIPPIVGIYKLCKKLGFVCSIVTARPEGPLNRKETVRMLIGNGIYDWDSLYMMPNSLRNKIKTEDQLRRYVSNYKYEARNEISKQHKIIANIGDMWHDLVRFPPSAAHKEIRAACNADCAIFFPKNAHNEVAIKLFGNTG